MRQEPSEERKTLKPQTDYQHNSEGFLEEWKEKNDKTADIQSHYNIDHLSAESDQDKAFDWLFGMQIVPNWRKIVVGSMKSIESEVERGLSQHRSSSYPIDESNSMHTRSLDNSFEISTETRL